MKSYKAIIFIALTALSFSCKKDDKAAEIEIPVCKISEITTNDDITSKITMKYDSIGRISEVEVFNIKYAFAYNGLTGKIEIFDRGVATLNPVNLTFDSSGRLTSLRFTEGSGAGALTHFCKFKYSSDGYLLTNEQTVSNISDSYSSIDSLIYTDGNLTQKIRKDESNSVTRTVNYTYGSLINKSYNFYWNELSSPFEFLGNIYFVYSLLGKPSKNLPTEISSRISGIVEKYEFDFLINSNGYVTEYNRNVTYSSTFDPTVYNIKLTQICQ